MKEDDIIKLIERMPHQEEDSKDKKVSKIFTTQIAVETVQHIASEMAEMTKRLHKLEINITSLEKCAVFWDYVCGFLLQDLLSKRDFKMFCRIIFPYVEQILPEDAVAEKVKTELRKKGLKKLWEKEIRYWIKIYKQAKREGKKYIYWSEPQRTDMVIANHEAFFIIHPLMHHSEFILEDIGMNKKSLALFALVFKMLRLQKKKNDSKRRWENFKSKFSFLKKAYKKLKFRFSKKAEIDELISEINKNRSRINANKSFSLLPFPVRGLFD